MKFVELNIQEIFPSKWPYGAIRVKNKNTDLVFSLYMSYLTLNELETALGEVGQIHV